MVVYIIAVIVYFTMRLVALSRVEVFIHKELVDVYRKSPISRLHAVDIIVGFIPYINVFFAFLFVVLHGNHVAKVVNNFEEWCKENNIIV